MAAVIGASITAALSLEAVGTTVIIGSITVNAVIGALVLTGVEFGVSQLLAPSQKASQQQVTTRQAIPSRRRYYGLTGTAGSLEWKAGAA